MDVEVNCVGAMIAHAKDVSETGICLIGEEALPEGKMLDLRFSLPGVAEPVHAFGKVMWTRKAGVYIHEAGVTFWQIDDDARAALADFLSRGVSVD